MNSNKTKCSTPFIKEMQMKPKLYFLPVVLADETVLTEPFLCVNRYSKCTFESYHHSCVYKNVSRCAFNICALYVCLHLNWTAVWFVSSLPYSLIGKASPCCALVGLTLYCLSLMLRCGWQQPLEGCLCSCCGWWNVLFKLVGWCITYGCVSYKSEN